MANHSGSIRTVPASEPTLHQYMSRQYSSGRLLQGPELISLVTQAQVSSNVFLLPYWYCNHRCCCQHHDRVPSSRSLIFAHHTLVCSMYKCNEEAHSDTSQNKVGRPVWYSSDAQCAGQPWGIGAMFPRPLQHFSSIQSSWSNRIGEVTIYTRLFEPVRRISATHVLPY